MLNILDNIYLYSKILPSGDPDPSGYTFTVKPGDYIADLGGQNNFAAKTRAITLPPYVAVTVWNKANKKGASSVFWGPTGTTVNWNQLSHTPVGGNITSIKVDVLLDANKWKMNCCQNNSTVLEGGVTSNETNCGQYWSQDPTLCGNSGYTAKDLLNEQSAKNWCYKHPSLCDAMKTEYCSKNMGAPQCACIAGVKSPTQIKYPTITVHGSCFPDSPCQKTDLVNMLVPTTISSFPCPNNVNTLIQDQITSINDSTVVGTTIGQSGKITSTTGSAGSNANNTGTTSEAGSGAGSSFMGIFKKYEMWIIFIVILILLIVVSIVVYINYSK